MLIWRAFVCLFRSGTEEEYAEKEAILQDLWDYAQSINYQLRVAPRSAGSAARRRRRELAGDLTKNTEELPWVPHWDDPSGDVTYSAAADSQCGQTRGKFSDVSILFRLAGAFVCADKYELYESCAISVLFLLSQLR